MRTSTGEAGNGAGGERAPGRVRPIALAAVAWLVGAATAVAVGLAALSFVGTGLLNGPADPLADTGDQPPQPGISLSPNADATGMPTSTSATAAPTALVTGADRQLVSDGGTIVARCIGDAAYLVLWSPAQGFHASDVVRGPALVARLQFESRTGEVKVRVTCVDLVPQAAVYNDN